MEKIKAIKGINVFLFLSALLQAVTGVLIVLERAGHVVSELHEFNGFVLIVLIGIHVVLNWPMIRSHYFRKKPA